MWGLNCVISLSPLHYRPKNHWKGFALYMAIYAHGLHTCKNQFMYEIYSNIDPINQTEWLGQIHSQLLHVLALFNDDWWTRKVRPLLTVTQWLTSHLLCQLVTNQKVPNDQTENGQPLERSFNPGPGHLGGTVGQSQLPSHWSMVKHGLLCYVTHYYVAYSVFSTKFCHFVTVLLPWLSKQTLSDLFNS